LPAHKQIVTETANQVAAVTAKSTEPIPPGKVKAIEGKIRDEAVGAVTIWQEVGGLVGRLILAMLAVQIVSRRALLRIFQIPSLIVVPLVFIWISKSLQDESSMFWIKFGIFACGVVVVSQFSFWGNYIPRVFPLHLRGTGESFAANIGGRIIGTAAAFLTLTFAESKPPDPGKIAYVGAIVAGCYCLIGIILTFLLPEPSSNDLGE
jgi:sugar phosphate permease